MAQYGWISHTNVLLRLVVMLQNTFGFVYVDRDDFWNYDPALLGAPVSDF